jgi:hypothetical protein
MVERDHYFQMVSRRGSVMCIGLKIFLSGSMGFAGFGSLNSFS